MKRLIVTVHRLPRFVGETHSEVLMRKANSARSSQGLARGADARITDVRWFDGTAFVAGEGKALSGVY